MSNNALPTLETLNLDTLPIPDTYRCLENVVPIINTPVATDWNDDHLGRILTWSNVRLNETQVREVGRSWLTSIMEGRISVRTAIQGLKLAMSLRSMNPRERKYLITEQRRTATATKDVLAAIDVPATDIFSAVPFSVRAQQVVPGSASTSAAAPATRIVPVAPAAPALGNDSDIQLEDSYSFLAAYLMKLLTKAPDNVALGVTNMKTRFRYFYRSSNIVRNFSITAERASAYKEALLSQARITLTYTHAVANTHQYTLDDLDPKEAEVLGYLCFLPLSYTGMHAYTLMVKLSNITKVELNKLLPLFHAHITAPALGKIRDILLTKEQTIEEPNRSVIFRYSTLWDAKYFQQVCTRQCPHLVYMLGIVYKRIAATSASADPERTVAAGMLSDDMKNTLRRAAEIIGDILKRNQMALQAPAREAEQVTEEDLEFRSVML